MKVFGFEEALYLARGAVEILQRGFDGFLPIVSRLVRVLMDLRGLPFFQTNLVGGGENNAQPSRA